MQENSSFPRTLGGVALGDVAALLDKPLPPEAYKRIPGPGDLTDIDAGWTRRVMNLVFGIYGIGWGFDFAQDAMVTQHHGVEGKSGMRAVVQASVYGQFWFALVEEGGKQHKYSFPVTGAHRNEFDNVGYAMKGAVTNAIGFGTSMLGFQESVYLGVRNHHTPGETLRPISLPENGKPEPAPEKPQPKPAVKRGPKPKQETPEPKPEPAPETPAPAPETPAPAPEKPAPAPEKPAPAPEKPAPEKPAPEKPAPEKPAPEKPTIPAGTFRGLICLSCGYGEERTKEDPVPPACPECGVVAGETFVFSPSKNHFDRMLENVGKRLKHTRGDDYQVPQKKAPPPPPPKKRIPAAERLSHVCTGCRCQFHGPKDAKCPVCDSTDDVKRDEGEDFPLSPARSDATRQDKLSTIYKLCGQMGINSVPDILERLTGIFNRTIKSSADLSDDDLDYAYKLTAYDWLHHEAKNGDENNDVKF